MSKLSIGAIAFAVGICAVSAIGVVFSTTAFAQVGKMSDIGVRVKKIVVEHLGVTPDNVTENATFTHDLGADSLDKVELLLAFELEFGCELPDDECGTVVTVGDAIKSIKLHCR